MKRKNTPVSELKKQARETAVLSLDISFRAHTGHVGSALSISDLLCVLYTDQLNVSRATFNHPDRDRFILSKGHAAAALYAVLYQRGILTKRQLDSFGADGGGLCEHPEIQDSGVEMTTGSLGHGLAFGTGIAMGINLQRTTDNLQQSRQGKGNRKSRIPQVFVLISDGECSEGALWESALLAPRLKLDNLTAILDYNKWECFGRIGEVTVLEPLAAKWRAFGWEVRETDGHNIRQIRDTYRALPFRKGKPSLILAHTVSGRGIPLIEDKLIGHYHVFSKDEYTTARKDLALQGETLRG